MTRSAWSGGVALLLMLLGASIAGAQSNKEELRKRYIRCAAVMAVAGTVVTNEKTRDGYTGGSMLFTVWASELDPQPKDAVDRATRELSAEVTRIGRDIGGTTPAAEKKFRVDYRDDIQRCTDLFVDEAKKRKRP